MIKVDLGRADARWIQYFVLEHEIRKAQCNKESVIAVFFDIEKACDVFWKEGLLIKL